MDAYSADRSLKGKLRRRIARLVQRRPVRMALERPMISFTFDDMPVTAALAGARALEQRGVRGTYYVSTGLAGQTGPMGVYAEAEDARRLGAHHVVLSTDEAQMAAGKGRFDLILDTVPFVHDLNPYLPTLALDGTLVLLGQIGPLGPDLSSVPLVMGRRAVAGSLIGGIAETQEMLDFCGRHGIVSDVEVIRMQDINGAYERMLRSDVKYRFVIDMASLKA